MMLHSADTLSGKIEEAIRSIPFDMKPATLYEPIRYALSVGGKRIRPLLVLLATDMFGKEVKVSMKPAIGIEIFHNFTLLHDDLMDNSDLRRGMPTVHRKWGANTAILSGDAMEVCQGQQLDMDFEKRTDVTEAEYLEMIALKTAVLLACSLKTGALLAGASPQDADLLYNFGMNIGLAFQLKDDLLDVYGDAKTFGKNIGGDIVNNKKTYLLIKALKSSGGKQHTELLKWISTEKFDKNEKIESVKNIYNDLNLKSISENLIEKYYLAALDCLSSINLADKRKKELVSLSENLMYRDK